MKRTFVEGSPRSRRQRGWPLALLALIFSGLFPSLGRADNSVQIEPLEGWSNFFGSRKIELHVTVKSSEALAGRADWALMIDRATVAKREEALTAAPGKPGQFLIRVTLPPVREGVVLAARLLIHVQDANGKQQANLDRPLWLFPDDPFAGRKESLKKRKIVLFDPARTTAPVWTKAGIPFEEQTNLAAVAEAKEGLVVIGEGASFKEEPQLPDILAKLGARGLPVLCLAPAEGRIDLSRVEKELQAHPSSVIWPGVGPLLFWTSAWTPTPGLPGARWC